MVKKIMVDCCKHCPECDLAYDGNKEEHFSVCWNNFGGVAPKKIDDIDVIPDWCGLEDD